MSEAEKYMIRYQLSPAAQIAVMTGLATNRVTRLDRAFRDTLNELRQMAGIGSAVPAELLELRRQAANLGVLPPPSVKRTAVKTKKRRRTARR